MTRPPDLDIFYAYTGIRYKGPRSRILRTAMADPRARELVWLYLAVNEIPWKRIRLPKRYMAQYVRQGQKASQLGTLWQNKSRYWLGRPFRVWYSKESDFLHLKASRPEEQRWRESIWLRKRQLTSSSSQLKKQLTVLLR